MFQQLVNTHYAMASAIIVVFDVNDSQSYISLKNWFTAIHNYAKKDVVKVLVGNKIDIRTTKLEGLMLAEQEGAQYIETSAKTGENVDSLFMQTAVKSVKINNS